MTDEQYEKLMAIRDELATVLQKIETAKMRPAIPYVGNTIKLAELTKQINDLGFDLIEQDAYPVDAPPEGIYYQGYQIVDIWTRKPENFSFVISIDLAQVASLKVAY